jgi:hypothetical protein
MGTHGRDLGIMAFEAIKTCFAHEMLANCSSIL